MGIDVKIGRLMLYILGLPIGVYKAIITPLWLIALVLDSQLTFGEAVRTMKEELTTHFKPQEDY